MAPVLCTQPWSPGGSTPAGLSGVASLTQLAIGVGSAKASSSGAPSRRVFMWRVAGFVEGVFQEGQAAGLVFLKPLFASRVIMSRRLQWVMWLGWAVCVRICVGRGFPGLGTAQGHKCGKRGKLHTFEMLKSFLDLGGML